MRYYPLEYNQINSQAGQHTPSAVKAYNNRSFGFWCRALFERAVSVLDFTVPNTWEGNVKDFFHYCIFRFGFVAISYNNEYGQFFQPCSLYGQDFYYQPTKAIIANPAYNAELAIGSECEILKLTPDYMGIWDIIEYFAAKLSLMDNAIDISLVNSKYAYFWGATTKAAAQSLKKMLDQVNKGEPAVIYDEAILRDPQTKESPFIFQEVFTDSAKHYITTNQLADFETIIHNFDAEIGIPSLPYAKKERLVSAEATIRGTDARARSLVWYETVTASIDRVKALYPDIKLSVSLHYKEPATDGGKMDAGDTETGAEV